MGLAIRCNVKKPLWPCLVPFRNLKNKENMTDNNFGPRGTTKIIFVRIYKAKGKCFRWCFDHFKLASITVLSRFLDHALSHCLSSSRAERRRKQMAIGELFCLTTCLQRISISFGDLNGWKRSNALLIYDADIISRRFYFAIDETLTTIRYIS